MKLTIGMATYDDYDGVYFTIQAIRTYHPEICKDTEFIIVDNNPGTPVSEALEKYCKGWHKGTAGMRYIPMPEATGTTQPRNRVFQEASGDAVLCIDSHILINAGGITRLLDYYDNHRTTRDILSGPILYDDGSICGDHFADVWRAQMWGIWGTTDKVNGDEPYEIPGMGLGLFSMRRSEWPGFNEYFRGFGGEEMYIHEKVRRRGGRAVCLPWLRWGHRFGRPNGTPYLSVCTVFNKVRNYILGHLELGLDLTRCHQHFVGEKIMSPQQWAYIMSNPIGCQIPTLPPENRVERGSNTFNLIRDSVGT